jgi:toxin FitB
VIIVDTNVISELMKPAEIREVRVFRWVGSIPEADLASTAIAYAESLYGVERLPEGRRKQAVRAVVSTAFSMYFGNRVLSFGTAAAEEFAILLAEREKSGLPIEGHDAQIAAIARANRASIATRDRNLRNCGVTVINPWDYEGP